MASDNGDFDTDLAAAPAKRMRYSFADEIAQSSHFEAFGQRFTGFPSGDCYGKYSKKRSDSSLAPVIPKTWRIFLVYVPTFAGDGRACPLYPSPFHSANDNDVISSLSSPRYHSSAFPSFYNTIINKYSMLQHYQYCNCWRLGDTILYILLNYGDGSAET